MAARQRRSQPKKPAAARTYTVPFLGDDDAQMVGAELEKAALAHQVNGIRHIDAELVMGDVESNARHPFRNLAGLKWRDDREAARRYRVGYISKLIASVQVVVVSTSQRKTYEPVFVSAAAPVVAQGSQALRRVHVVRHDALSNDPAFLSFVNTQCRRMLHLLKQLEHTAAARPLPPSMQQFIATVRDAANTAGFG